MTYTLRYRPGLREEIVKSLKNDPVRFEQLTKKNEYLMEHLEPELRSYGTLQRIRVLKFIKLGLEFEKRRNMLSLSSAPMTHYVKVTNEGLFLKITNNKPN